jgi:flagellar basal body-associated protein FliL
MALAKKQSRSDRLVIIALVVIVVAGIGYLVYTKWYLNRSTTNNRSAGNSAQTVITNFGTELLNNPQFTNTQDYGVNINADVNQAGQPDPFQ